MTEVTAEYKTVKSEEVKIWHKAASVDAFPTDGGAAIEYKGLQVAIFNFSRRGEWYASQNLCPHKKQMILSRGMLGSEGQEPKVACPFHKKTFSLKTGVNLNGSECDLATYPVKVEEGYVYVGFSQ
ncbi:MULTISPECIES: nitrite reductase small subunit NirD [Reichenbachiella]|uniref:nitrite reductase small subunit NirD n=1 Tax=Reichenbachiella TaxID=156993 RepID=UPI000E6CB445|nr:MULTISPECIES: nitrite reductase small subunit NirD [Reichenbachiella]MBU2913302.1 nitrite reductase small subunit NirD [Reichenbachiella agariperforans]RJE74711.1 nitrite reductase small subunit [Reichenbachiella sp. MSK19-1]